MLITEKTTVRRKMRERRKSLSLCDRDAFDLAICEKLMRLTDRRSPVAVYLASSDEISIDRYIESLLLGGYVVVSPRWNGREYELAKVEDLESGSLRRGPMDIREPCGVSLVSPRDVALWIVPGLAFTRDGFRLGYGGGWYDRLLSKASPSAPRIGVAYSFQIVDSLPVEPHDIMLTGVVDEK